MFFRLHLISKTRVLREFSALVSVSVIVSVDILKLHISEASQLAYKKLYFLAVITSSILYFILLKLISELLHHYI